MGTNLSNSFLFHISPDHFPGFKIMTPVYARVDYFIDESYNGFITGITFPPSVFPVVSGRSRIVEDMEQVVIALAADLKEREDVCSM